MFSKRNGYSSWLPLSLGPTVITLGFQRSCQDQSSSLSSKVQGRIPGSSLKFGAELIQCSSLLCVWLASSELMAVWKCLRISGARTSQYAVFRQNLAWCSGSSVLSSLSLGFLFDSFCSLETLMNFFLLNGLVLEMTFVGFLGNTWRGRSFLLK